MQSAMSLSTIALLACMVQGKPQDLSPSTPLTRSHGGSCSPKSVQCVLPSLGQTGVKLGNGWDIRSGRAVASSTPWSSKTIEDKQETTPNGFKEAFFNKERQSSDRATSLNVDASLEVNVLSGMVDVGAGGKYLTSQKKSFTSVRFLLDYSSKNHFISIPVSGTPADNKDFCSSNSQATVGGPTHVITSVQYGTKAFVLFEREVSRGEEEDDVSAWMNLALSDATKGVKSKVNTTSTDINKYSKSSVKLHFLGNAVDITTPTSLADVNKCIEQLDTASNDNPQPLSFTITKIDQICSSADVVFSSIENPILDSLAVILRSFADNKLRTDTLLIEDNSVAKRHGIRQALVGPGSFGKKLDDFGADFKKQLSRHLVDVRSSNSGNDDDLKEIIKQVKESPFEQNKAKTFLEFVEREVNSFDYLYSVTNVQVDDADRSIQKKCTNGGDKDTFVFILNVLPKVNWASDYFSGKLNSDQILIPSDVRGKFRQFRSKAQKTQDSTSCFVVDFADMDPDHSVTFRVVDMFGDTQEHHETLPKIPERQVTLSSTCRWVDGVGWGSTATCGKDELAAGACAGGGGWGPFNGGSKDCNNGYAVHRLYCCKVSEKIPATIDDSKCKTIRSGYGEAVNCFAQQEKGLTVHSSCSSGLNGDCGSGKFNRADCCPAKLPNGMAVGARGENDCANWRYGTYGEDLTCGDKNYVVVARCGSGKNKDCPHNSSHGIRCCKLFIF